MLLRCLDTHVLQCSDLLGLAPWSGLKFWYFQYAGEQFDAVMGLEIVEHVDKPQQFLKTLASLTKSDGALFISTINRTARGYALTILGAEYIAGILPKGTHDWDKFITPGN